MSDGSVNETNSLAMTSYSEGIHDADAIKSLYWEIELKNGNGSLKNIMHYNLKVSAVRSSSDKHIVWTTTLSGRYVLNLEFKLELSVESNGLSILHQMFHLESGAGEQKFTTDLKQFSHLGDVKKLKLIAKLRCLPGGLITEWRGTETDFKCPNRAHNVVLVVGGRKFYVVKEYLATWSRFFDRLFYGEFAEKDKAEIEVKDVDPLKFHYILGLIHPNRSYAIDDSNVISIFELADHLDMPSIMSQCGKYLQDFDNCKKMLIIDRLELADKYNLVSLLLSCLEKIHSLTEIEYGKFREQYRDRLRQLSQNTLANII